MENNTAHLEPAKEKANEPLPRMTCSAVIRQIPQVPQSQRPLCDQISLLWAAANKLGLYDAADFICPEKNSGFVHPPQNAKLSDRHE